MFYILSKNLFSFLRVLVCCIFVVYLVCIIRVYKLRTSDKTGMIMMLGIGFHKLANVIFVITQKPFFIKS